ncbi:MAG: hypothetical protein K0S01_469 [Herbinix sp.]|nr:hypothetical protein [Herbinix sp.]
MDNLIVIPQVGIGEVKLGMHRDEVHELVGTNDTNIKTDSIVRGCYYDFCFQIEYDSNNIVNFIEIINNPTYNVVFEGVDVFKTKAEKLVSYVEQFSKYLETPSAQLGSMYIFEDIGISLYRSIVCKEETMKEPWFLQLSQEQKEDELRFLYFETIAIWCKGYYDSVNLYI